MWDDSLDTALGLLWEALFSEQEALSTAAIKQKTGLSLSRIYSSLGKMAEVGLLYSPVARAAETGQPKSNGVAGNESWAPKKELDAWAWARAVEIGIPLSSLEKTVGLSFSQKKVAEKMASSGKVDQEQNKTRAKKVKERKDILRGRAASRAATTDLAKIVEDAQQALTPGSDNKIKQAILLEAQKALESLVKAMERI